MTALIAAVARNGVIGAGGRIPWDIPEDRAHFKELTMGHILVMGRRTFEEIGRPLPGRITIVVSKTLAAREAGGAHALKAEDALVASPQMKAHDAALKADDALSVAVPHALNEDTGLLFASSLEDALQLAQETAPEKTVFIAGGGQLYEAALPLADVLYLTEIDAEIAGDTYFPAAAFAGRREILQRCCSRATTRICKATCRILTSSEEGAETKAARLGQPLFVESEVTGSGVSASGLSYRYVTYLRRVP